MKKDKIMAEGKWEFDKNVSECFDDMLSRSIPDYTTMRDLTLRLADKVLCNKRKFSMIDLGCSNGINLDMFINYYGNKGSYIGIDNSSDMINNAREKLSKYDNCDITLFNQDIRYFDFTKYWSEKCDLITSILTMQFVPIECRAGVINDIINCLPRGGMLIMVEKVLQPSYKFDSLFVDTYYDIKGYNGYTEEQIQLKRKALEGVLVPNTQLRNKNILRDAGFSVETFWKCLNFEGYVCFKG